MKRSDHLRLMAFPSTGMLFLPEIEERLDWAEFTWEEHCDFEWEKMQLYDRHAENLDRLYEEFWEGAG